MPWKYQVDQIQNDQIEAIIDFNNCARYLNDHYKTKCVISDRPIPSKMSTWSNYNICAGNHIFVIV